jgi:hypothetical protein
VGWEKIVAREDIADHLENHNLVAAERRALGMLKGPPTFPYGCGYEA